MCRQNLDAQGNTLLYDYTNGLHPNIIAFTVSATNNYVNTSLPAVQLVCRRECRFIRRCWWTTPIRRKRPGRLTVRPTSRSISDSTEGWHEVWLACGTARRTSQRGVGNGDGLSWKPPRHNWSSPARPTATVTVPVIQLTGYSPEALSASATASATRPEPPPASRP